MFSGAMLHIAHASLILIPHLSSDSIVGIMPKHALHKKGPFIAPLGTVIVGVPRPLNGVMLRDVDKFGAFGRVEDLERTGLPFVRALLMFDLLTQRTRVLILLVASWLLLQVSMSRAVIMSKLIRFLRFPEAIMALFFSLRGLKLNRWLRHVSSCAVKRLQGSFLFIREEFDPSSPGRDRPIRDRDRGREGKLRKMEARSSVSMEAARGPIKASPKRFLTPSIEASTVASLPPPPYCILGVASPSCTKAVVTLGSSEDIVVGGGEESVRKCACIDEGNGAPAGMGVLVETSPTVLGRGANELGTESVAGTLEEVPHISFVARGRRFTIDVKERATRGVDVSPQGTELGDSLYKAGRGLLRVLAIFTILNP
ncbi:uncharacterized protein G2W53_021815 [Senna tora]|uniref:Uncharacterized protein n=1 Tax=Senna tora TaxID=362788 RepID=A0A834WLG2_9FABA|nr:uncharacterized protein G2W53_021815 [Senna tora]